MVAVMRGNCVGGNWLMKWDEVKKIPLCGSDTSRSPDIGSSRGGVSISARGSLKVI